MQTSGRLLVVDDDPSVRAMLLEYLGGHRYEVRAAENGAAMRAEIERDLPDLVLLDIRMPGMDGLTLARFLRERYDVGIIMVTAAAGVVDRVVGLEVGADDYVTKPFDPRELSRASRASCAACRRARPKARVRRGPSGSAPRCGRRCGTGPVRPLRARRRGPPHVRGRGAEVAITAMEYDLLCAFLASRTACCPATSCS